MEKQPLSFGEILGILGIPFGIFIGVCPMTWWIKTILLSISILMIIYAVNNLRWTIGLSQISKIILSVLTIIILAIISLYPIIDQWKKDHITPNAVGEQKQLTKEEIAEEVIKKLPNRTAKELNRPYFAARPKLIIDMFNHVQSLDIIIANIGKNPANPMFGYTIIYQDNPPDLIFIVHPQSFSNDLVVGMPRVIHEPSVKMMKLEGKQYVFLYLHYTDLNSKKTYSQPFYFERIIYKNGMIEYSDASSEHKKEMDIIRKANYSYIEELVNSGADEKALRNAMKQHGQEARDVTDF